MSIRAGFLIAAVAAGFAAGPAHAEREAPGDAALLARILDARADSFAALKQGRLAPVRGDEVWSAALSPFGLSCRVLEGGALAAYFCTNAHEVAGEGDAPKTGLSDEEAGDMVRDIVHAFRKADPALEIEPGASAAAEDRETLIARAPGRYVATIDEISLTGDGDENDATVNLTIYAPELARDPLGD
ncbi:MAG: hypothetical protein JOZ55_07595 [Alphaproteobacteria bacterium]|nr:hypothetical protein [Alphaproteobacteria bacterium]